MKKRILSALLALTMLLSTLPGTVLAADDTTDPHPTEAQLTELGYSFASGYKISNATNETSIYVNGVVTPIPINGSIDIKVLQHTDSNQTYRVLFMSVMGNNRFTSKILTSPLRTGTYTLPGGWTTAPSWASR